MTVQSLMSIGRFAHLSGVTVHMLRHYDEVGLLSPARVDDTSLYRRYHPDQIRVARLIRALRSGDVPIEMIKQILEADAAGDELMVRQLLQNHRERLVLERDHLTNRINDMTRILERGLPMETIRPGCHPVQIKIAVGDHGAGVEFYRDALALPYDVARRTQTKDRKAFMFGEYGKPGFFLLWLVDDPERLDRPGRTHLEFQVPDVDLAHRQALAGGATQISAPQGGEGSLRHSVVTDPWGNWLRLIVGPSGPRPTQLVLAVDDMESAVAFFHAAFGLACDVTETGSRVLTFGCTEDGDAFSLLLSDDHERLDQPGRATFSFLVDDLDTTYRQALAAGAREVTAPRDAEGMPRGAGVQDPSGNMIGMAQA